MADKSKNENRFSLRHSTNLRRKETPPIREDWTHYRPDKQTLQIAVLLAIAGTALLIGLEKTPWFGRRTLTLAVTRSDANTAAEAFLQLSLIHI